MECVVILDFLIGKVFVYNYSAKDIADNFNDDIELYIDSRGHKVSECQWMCSNKLKLEIN